VLVIARSPSVKTTKNSITDHMTTNTLGSTPAPASIANDVASVSTATLDSVGIGSAKVLPHAISATALTQNAKPEILYEGAEYCPFCATERWPIAVALARFGTFQNLRVTHSSTTDVYPNTQTLSFYHATYTSQYVSFDPIEIYTNIPAAQGYTSLQTPTAAENRIVSTYDNQPYLPSADAGSIPFIDFGNKALIAGATYDPSLLAGKSLSQIAGSLNTPSSPIAKGVDGAANTITATICKLTNNQPAAVCSSTIQSIEGSV
jgi:hypothetical protein